MIKDIVEAAKIRLRTPYFGYAALAFVAFNWRAIFLLCLVDGSPAERLKAFDDETSTLRLLVFPLLAGVAVAATSEWIRLLFNLISSYPTEKMVNLQLTSEHRRLLRTAELEVARSKVTEAREKEAYRRAKQDEAAAQITDEETKRKLQTELSEIRKDGDEKGNRTEALPVFAAELLMGLHRAGSNEIRTISYLEGDSITAGDVNVSNGTDPRRYTNLLDGVETLLARGLLTQRFTSSSGAAYSLTSSGWEEMDRVVKEGA